jgi:hypothetical protein
MGLKKKKMAISIVKSNENDKIQYSQLFEIEIEI